jgi:hypothetical protein
VTGTLRRSSEAGMRSKQNAGVNAYLARWGEGGSGGGNGRGGKRNAAAGPAGSGPGAGPGPGGSGGAGDAKTPQSAISTFFKPKPKVPRTGD